MCLLGYTVYCHRVECWQYLVNWWWHPYYSFFCLFFLIGYTCIIMFTRNRSCDCILIIATSSSSFLTVWLRDCTNAFKKLYAVIQIWVWEEKIINVLSVLPSDRYGACIEVRHVWQRTWYPLLHTEPQYRRPMCHCLWHYPWQKQWPTQGDHTSLKSSKLPLPCFRLSALLQVHGNQWVVPLLTNQNISKMCLFCTQTLWTYQGVRHS